MTLCCLCGAALLPGEAEHLADPYTGEPASICNDCLAEGERQSTLITTSDHDDYLRANGAR